MDGLFLEKIGETLLGVRNGEFANGYLAIRVWEPGCFYPAQLAKIRSISKNTDSQIIELHERQTHITLDCAAIKKVENMLEMTAKIRGKGKKVINFYWFFPEKTTFYHFIPSVFYGDNNAASGFGFYPILSSETDHSRPNRSRNWSFRADRSSHRMSSVFLDNQLYAISGDDLCQNAEGTFTQYNGLGIGLDGHEIAQQDHDTPSIMFSIGFRNRPLTHSVIPGEQYPQAQEGWIDLDRGPIESTLILSTCWAQNRVSGSDRLLRAHYYLQRPRRPAALKASDALESLCDALAGDGYSEHYKNFPVLVWDRDDIRTTVNPPTLCTAWTSGIQCAGPLLFAAKKTGNAHWRQRAISVIDNIADNALSPASNLFFEAHDGKNWTTHGWWYDMLRTKGHSAYLNGQICHYLLSCYSVESSDLHNNWLNAALTVLNHMISVQLANGSFGYVYSEQDGSIIDDDGFAGCWFVPAMATAYRITEQQKYLQSAQRAMDYYRQFVESLNCYATPHDTYKAVEEEGNLAFIKAAHYLHDITGEATYLNDLAMGAAYEFTWKFAYNVTIQYEPLKSIGWRSCGGSVTSVCNTHVHPMGSMVIEDLMYLAKLTNDHYVKHRIEDTLDWSMQTYNLRDGYLGFGKKGWTPERFCYTDSLLLERFKDGSPSSTWFAYLTWAAGSLIEGLAATE